MKIVTVQFDIEGYTDYKMLLEVFEASVRRHMPDVTFEKFLLEGERRTPTMRCGKWANTRKLAKWVELVENSDEDLILADCDMLAIRSAEHAFDKPFDVAYTRRLKVGSVPFNNGIMMVRPNERSRDFFRRWEDVNWRMYNDEAFHQRWNKKYKGMNQTAFGYLLETGEHNAVLHSYMTQEWNAVDPDWGNIDENTVFIHIKGKLRSAVIRGASPMGAVVYPASLWYSEAGEAIPERYLGIIRGKYERKNMMAKRRYKRNKSHLEKVAGMLEMKNGRLGWTR